MSKSLHVDSPCQRRLSSHSVIEEGKSIGTGGTDSDGVGGGNKGGGVGGSSDDGGSNGGGGDVGGIGGEDVGVVVASMTEGKNLFKGVDMTPGNIFTWEEKPTQKTDAQ